MRQTSGYAAMILVAAGVACALGGARAQDVITTRTQTFQGKVLDVSEQGVRIRLSQGGEVSIPRAGIVDLKVTAPSVILRGIEAYEKGDLREAKLSLGSAVMKFVGLDTDWAAKGLLYYGRACLRERDYENAGKALALVVEQYPDHPLLLDATISLASIELANGRYEPALARFEELLEPLARQVKPPKNQVPYAAEILIGIAQCRAALGQPDEALDACLKVIGLYPVEPYYSEALYRAARLYAEAGQWRKADQMLSELAAHGTAGDWKQKGAEEHKAVQAGLAAEPNAGGPAAPAPAPGTNG